ncbi:MAG TPA: copper amine oxidase N-terminal domain-containing protein [Acetivibrio sp.]|uniref:copper amine oxidase N-terminal domain-containing protein n=1 Tax=Acetivibrio sp. TaxID=1872092 RepID=UPI002CB35610|nr:copper amine oxidase N-terminal domain-containing protein [Acetivibrio sp.]HOM01494.1 copper amine oxidase N-terminal domain-containing protein [Acetivibrio sp.]
MNLKAFISLLVSVSLIAASFIMPVGVLAQTQGKTVVLQVNNTVATVNNESVTLDVAPYIDKTSNRTLVPLRFISESLGYTVTWDGEEKTVRILNKVKMNTIDESFVDDSTGKTVEYFRSWNTYKYIKLKIGSDVAEICDDYIIGEYVEMTEVPLEQAPVIKDGRTMLPIRFVAEQMNLKVDWDAKTQKITISSKGEEYVPGAAETLLKKIAVSNGSSGAAAEDDSAYIKSKQPQSFLVKITSLGMEYSVDLAIQSPEGSQAVLSGSVIGLKEDKACFSYTLNSQREYKYDGTIQVTDDGFIVNYTDEKGEKCSVTFPAN